MVPEIPREIQTLRRFWQGQLIWAAREPHTDDRVALVDALFQLPIYPGACVGELRYHAQGHRCAVDFLSDLAANVSRIIAVYRRPHRLIIEFNVKVWVGCQKAQTIYLLPIFGPEADEYALQLIPQTLLLMRKELARERRSVEGEQALGCGRAGSVLNTVFSKDGT